MDRKTPEHHSLSSIICNGYPGVTCQCKALQAPDGIDRHEVFLYQQETLSKHSGCSGQIAVTLLKPVTGGPGELQTVPARFDNESVAFMPVNSG